MIRLAIFGGITLIVVPLLLAEFFECAPWMADRILEAASRRLPAVNRKTQLCHWRGDVDALPGKLVKVFSALHILITSGATGRELVRFQPRSAAALQASNAAELEDIADNLLEHYSAEFRATGVGAPDLHSKLMRLAKAFAPLNPEATYIIVPTDGAYRVRFLRRWPSPGESREYADG